jgi:hypothetical protein
MAPGTALLRSLNEAGLRLEADGVRLVVEPASKLTHETRQTIREHKAELLAALAEASRPVDDFDERAALTQFEAGVPREWAEGFARLQMSRPPAGLSFARWRQVIDDGGHFIDRWAAHSTALGWRTLDVFGVHAERPAERFDVFGLVWAIRGSAVVDIAAMTATLETPTGARQVFYRRSVQHAESVAIWKLTKTA